MIADYYSWKLYTRDYPSFCTRMVVGPEDKQRSKGSQCGWLYCDGADGYTPSSESSKIAQSISLSLTLVALMCSNYPKQCQQNTVLVQLIPVTQIIHAVMQYFCNLFN